MGKFVPKGLMIYKLDQGGYVEYKYYFEYDTSQGGVVSSPSPNPTAFMSSTTCNTSGYFSGPAGSGWIRITVTAHTCDKDGNEIPGSLTSDVASITLAVVEVSSIDVDKDKNCVQHNFTFTAVTNPTGYGSLVNWTGGGTPATGSGSNFVTQWSLWGEKTVTALNKNKTVDVTYDELADWDEYLACGDLIQHPTKAKVTDGCSPPYLTPSNPCGGEHTDFVNCCYEHDFDYRECGLSKTIADDDFRDCMEAVCVYAQNNGEEALYACCMTKALEYYTAVRTFALGAYQNAQTEYCVCCD